MKLAKKLFTKMQEAKRGGKAPKWYSKVADIISDIADDEAMRSRVYRISDGESDDLKGDKDLSVPYWWDEDGPRVFLHGAGNHNLEFWKEFLELDGAEKFIEKNWKMSYGESGGMMPHSDANAPSGAVVMMFAGDGHDEEFMVDIGNLWSDKKIQKLAKDKKDGFNIKDFARFFLLSDDSSYMKPEYDETKVAKAKKDKDIEELEMYGYVPADMVTAVYVNGKDMKSFLSKLDNSADWMEKLEDVEE